MDINFTPEQQAFREEIRAFLDKNLPISLKEKMQRDEFPSKQELMSWTGLLHAQGWSAPNWPSEWGGPGWDSVKLMIFRDEMQSYPAPEPLSFGVNMVGPVIYTFGNEQQKQRFLPRIARLDDWWCQGFSEPGAGSDLASLKTKAERCDGGWVINGQKAWTSHAQNANWIFVLARTNGTAKKQKGISFFLIDMSTPGLTVQPTQMIDYGYEVNEVFFDDVFVPQENLVGEENKGWDYARFLLSNERSGQARLGVSKARLKRIRNLAGKRERSRRSRLEDPLFARRLVELEVEALALEMTLFRVAMDEQTQSENEQNQASSILKIRGSQLQQDTAELLLDIAGPAGLMRAKEGEGEFSDIQGVGAAYFNLRKLSIYGGSNEIQRTIIANSILGLS